MIVSIEAEKALDKIQYLFIIQTTQLTRNRKGTSLAWWKSSTKPTANTMIHGKNNKCIPHETENKSGLSILATFTQYFTGSPSQYNKARQQIGK